MSQSIEHTDHQLVEFALQDVDQYALILERYEKKLMYYVMRISHFSGPEAEEILQEVFLKVWLNLRDYDSSIKFSSWIYRITHNETISAYRKAKSRGQLDPQQTSLENDDPEGISLLEKLPSNLDLNTELDTKIDHEKIRIILSYLDEKYREVLVLKFLEEKSYEEISDILRKPSGTIATLISRAKAQFREVASRHQITFCD